MTNSSVDEIFSTVIGIQPNILDFQEGISNRISMEDANFVYFSDVLCIKVERIDGNSLNNSIININKNIAFTIKNNDGSSSDQVYCLNSLICHRCCIPKLNHFISIVIKNNVKYYCNDFKILEGIPNNSSMNAINSE